MAEIMSGIKYAAGFQTDMTRLLEKFMATKSTRFTEFSKLWSEMEFSLIFCGRKDPRENRLFFEEITRSILKLWNPVSDYQEKVFAQYMLYAVYVMQPHTPKIKIRLQQSDLKHIEELQQLATKYQHLDVCYCIHRMHLEDCFHFVASLKQRTPLNSTDKEEDDDSAILKHEVFSNVGRTCKGGSLQQLAVMHKEYVSMKHTAQSSEGGDRAMVQENIAEELIKEMAKLLAKHRGKRQELAAGEIDDSSEESPSSEEETDIASRRKTLRQQQFSSTSTTRKRKRFEQLLGD